MRYANPNTSTFTVAVLLCTCGVHHEQGDTEHLVLSRTAEFELPAGFDVGGAALLDSARIVAWSRTDGRVWIHRGGKAELLSIEGFDQKYRYGPIGASFTSDTTLEVLGVTDTTFELAILDPRRGGAVRDRIRLSGLEPPSKALAGLLVHRRWVFIVGTPKRLMVVAPDARQGRVIWSLDSTAFRPALPDSLVNIDLLPARHTRGMLLTLQWAPHQVFLVDSAGEILLDFRPPSIGLDCESGDGCEAPTLISLPTIELDRGYLQTLADLKSDKRYLITYDSLGNHLRTSVIEAPFGFVASSVPQAVALAVGYTGTPRLMLYSWRWGRSPSMKGRGKS